MNLASLQEYTNTLENLDKFNRTLAAKLAVAEEKKAHERSLQFLLNFELSQLKSKTAATEKELEELEKDHLMLVSFNKKLSLQVKHIRNYFGLVNSIQVDRKAEWIQNLRDELNQIDFTREAHHEDPQRDIDALTQLAQR